MTRNENQMYSNISSIAKSLEKRSVNVDFANLEKLDELNRELIQKKESLENEKKEISKSKDESLFKKSKDSANDFKKLSIKFNELKSLVINYKDDKEIEIEKLRNEINEFKTMIESSRNSYEEILDKTTQSIEKYIETTETNSQKNLE